MNKLLIIVTIILSFVLACGGDTEQDSLSSLATVEAKLALISTEATVQARVEERLRIPTETPTPIPTETSAPIPTKTTTPIPTKTPTPIPTKTPTKTSVSGIDVYEKVRKTVVRIESREGTGTGFIISKDGLIVTNSHVVENNTTVDVTLHDGTMILGYVVGEYKDEDIALVSVSAVNLQYLDYSNYVPIEVGQPVLAIGFPRGFAGDPTLTRGYVSALRTNVAHWRGSAEVIQTDTALNPGNSGGPLFDDQGNLIGINTFAWDDSEGLNFAININDAASFIEQLVSNSKNPAPTVLPTATFIPTPHPTQTPLPSPAGLIFGPWSGNLTGEDGNISIYDPHIFEDNFVISGEVSLPNYVPNRTKNWSIGFVFRDTSTAAYHIRIKNDQYFEHKLVKYHPNGPTEFLMIDNGHIPHVKILQGSSNSLKLVVLGSEGWLWVNDQYITKLSLTDITEAGHIDIAGGFYNTDVKDDYQWENVRIKSIESVQVKTSGSIPFVDDGLTDDVSLGKHINISNLILEVSIENPDETSHIGSAIRHNESTRKKFVLQVSSKESSWIHYFYQNKWIEIDSGGSSAIKRSKGETNHIKIIADENIGALFINNIFVISLDLSRNLDRGSINIYGSLRGAARSNSLNTNYHSTKLWHLGE